METTTTLNKGDIIRSPRGYLASVNWSKIGKIDNKPVEWIGCTFIDRGFKGIECMTYRADEVFVVRRGANEFWNEMFKQISDEELRNEIRTERALRMQMPKRKPEVQVVARTRSLLKDLTDEDQEALIQLIRARRREKDLLSCARR
jgi:hypothetical protein